MVSPYFFTHFYCAVTIFHRRTAISTDNARNSRIRHEKQPEKTRK